MKLFVVAAALSLCACGDFFEGVAGTSGACGPGLSREPGPACSVPEIQQTLDGSGQEWPEDTAAIIPQCVDCAVAGAVSGMQVARDDGFLLVRLLTDGAPSTETDSRYVIQMRRLDLPLSDQNNTTIGLLLWESDYVMSFNGNWIRGLALEHVFGDDGIEVRIPLDSVPFADGARIAGYYRLPDGTVDREFLLLSEFCWNPDASGDPCST